MTQTWGDKSTVFFDGSCPLCRAEIGHYRGRDLAGKLQFIDVSVEADALPKTLGQTQAMRRFHVLSSNGELLSGAAAFVHVWRQIPGWRWAARAATTPGATAALEFGYRLFLILRPTISWLFGNVQKFRPIKFHSR